MKNGLHFLVTVIALFCLSSCPNPMSEADLNPDESTTYYQLIYNVNGFKNIEIPQDTNYYTTGESALVQRLESPVFVDGSIYNFVGWNTVTDGSGESYYPDSYITIEKADITLYAQWTEEKTFTLKYIGNGSDSGTMPSSGNRFLPGQTVKVSQRVVGFTGKTFIGWNTASDGSGETYTAGTTFSMPENDVVLFAEWSDESGFDTYWDLTIDNSNSITLPLIKEGNYSFQVNWGDGTGDTITEYKNEYITHNYSTPDIYNVTITGVIEGWRFGYSSDSHLITEIKNWGPLSFGRSKGRQFKDCVNLKITADDTPDLSNTENLSFAFSNYPGETISNINNWDISQITDISYLFNHAESFNQNLNNWDTSKITDMNHSFYYSTAFNGVISDWKTSSVNNMQGMFSSAKSFDQDISNWDTSSVNSMEDMFSNAQSFNQDISGWEISNVTTTSEMFSNATSFKQDISQWDISNVTNLSFMFNGCYNFKSDLSDWNTSKVTNMAGTFSFASNFNQDISDWDTSNVTSMARMFDNAYRFNQDISGWNTSKVKSMHLMFRDAYNFNQDISDWNTSSVRDMERMFKSASSFNQNISKWNTSNVTEMEYMFYSASRFNQDISSWNISNVKNMYDILKHSRMSTDNYNKLLIGWSSQSVQSNVKFGIGSIQYSSDEAETARESLISSYNWIITDGGRL